MWILGEEFVARSGNIIESREVKTSFLNTNYQVRAIGASGITNTLNPDPLARMRNTLITAIHRFNCLPRYLIIIPEDDIIKGINRDDYGVTEFYGQTIEWMLREQAKIIEEYKKFLPRKATKNRKGWPEFIWVYASIHTNYSNFNLRLKFNKCLKDVAKFNSTISAIRISELWNSNDNILVSQRNNLITPTGWKTFWAALDSAMQKYENITSKYNNNIEEKKHEETSQRRRENELKHDKEFSRHEERPQHRNWRRRIYYNPSNKWGKPNFFKNNRREDRREKENKGRRQLPTPPRY